MLLGVLHNSWEKIAIIDNNGELLANSQIQLDITYPSTPPGIQSEPSLRNLQNAQAVGLQQHCMSSGFEEMAASHSTSRYCRETGSRLGRV